MLFGSGVIGVGPLAREKGPSRRMPLQAGFNIDSHQKPGRRGRAELVALHYRRVRCGTGCQRWRLRDPRTHRWRWAAGSGRGVWRSARMVVESSIPRQTLLQFILKWTMKSVKRAWVLLVTQRGSFT